MVKLSRLLNLLISIRYFHLTYKVNKIKKEILASDECVILGNGPSLKDSFDEDISFIKNKKKVCVNSFAESKYYAELKPEFYILADPLFWDKDYKSIFDSISKIDSLGENSSSETLGNINAYKKLKLVKDNLFKSLVEKTKWRLNLFVPLHSKPSKVFEDLATRNNNINVIYYSAIPINFKLSFFRHISYTLNIGMPTPQNVLIAAIFLALKINFKKIYLIGADHSWHEDLVLDENNILCLKDKHFYNQNEIKLTPLVGDIKNGTITKMHEQYYALYLTFRSHMFCESYSKKLNSLIANYSKKTYIDAYERKK